MVLSVKEVKNPTDKKQFIQLPWKIYGDFPLWVPPLISERKKFLDPAVNPFFKDSKVDLFLSVEVSTLLTLRAITGARHLSFLNFSQMRLKSYPCLLWYVQRYNLFES